MIVWNIIKQSVSRCKLVKLCSAAGKATSSCQSVSPPLVSPSFPSKSFPHLTFTKVSIWIFEQPAGATHTDTDTATRTQAQNRQKRRQSKIKKHKIQKTEQLTLQSKV